MLKAFPSKAAGAIAMITSMLILLSLPWVDSLISVGSVTNDPRFRPFFRIIFLIFVINMFMLG
jgi:ubiquinol-cytochrome c reductase cytochrome b subunit